MIFSVKNFHEHSRMLRANTAIPDVSVDQIPTDPSTFKARVVAVAVTSLAALAAAIFFYLPPALDVFLSRNAGVHILFQRLHTDAALRSIFQLSGLLAILCATAGIAGFFLKRITWHTLRLPLYGVYLLVVFYAWVTWEACSTIIDEGIEIDGAPPDKVAMIRLWWNVTSPGLAMVVFAAWTHVMLRSRSVYAAFTREEGEPMVGDHVLEDLRTHGRDPHHRRSLYASTFTHFAILILIPWILSLGGCSVVEPYKAPKGSGNPVVAMVKMVKPKKKKKQTLSLRPNSAILYEIPDLDDSQVDEQMEKETQATYAANNAKAGKMGKGGGTQGGWPEGAEDYKIRFIRLEHNGPGWDDGMDESNADINFLRSFAQATGFKKIANKGESHSIALLKKYPKDGFPPFVFLTGDGAFEVNDTDRKILRDYCLNGGMLIADAGSVSFHNSFKRFISQVFPDKPLIDIADDDMLYQVPYTFPNGAPPFWRLGGTRALGVKHEGRWVAFYHPGDMNGAWKSQGYTDVTPEMRDAAMNLGVNLIYYAFNQWNDAVSKKKQ